MCEWIFSRDGYDSGSVITNGNAFLLANGYMGCRGTLEEHSKEQLAGINLAGVYDRCGDKWRETVNAPNPLYGTIRIKGRGEPLCCEQAVSHAQSLDMRRGVGRRHTSYALDKGTLCFSAERFVSMDSIHIIVSRWEISADIDCEIEILTGIDADVYDCNGPHLFDMALAELDGTLTAHARTCELGIKVCTAECISFDGAACVTQDGSKLLHFITITLAAGDSVVIEKFASVFTSRDCDDAVKAASELALSARSEGYRSLLEKHKERWEALWRASEVVIEGDAEAQQAVNFSLYHLHSIAPRHCNAMSIPARGLSGQTYKGAVFWDTEMFMLPFFLYTEPKVARSFLEYRITGLKGARAKAREYGFEGAFFAWESQEKGAEACSDYNVTDVFTGRLKRTYFRDKQIHISGDVAYALWEYVRVTGDVSLLVEGGMELLMECARFYRSRGCRWIGSDTVEYHDVIGPDEYHERVNNNAYTNRIARHTFDVALKAYELLCRTDAKAAKEICRRLFKKGELGEFTLLRESIKQSKKDANGVVEQYDGYFALEDCIVGEVRNRLLNPNEYWGGANGVASHTQVIKQADVITMMQLFPGEYSDEDVLRNWRYYMPRTEHGSSLSACMYALAACRVGLADEAYPLFIKSARMDMDGGGKQFAGGIYIGGTHPAAAGGAWMTAVFGFAGFKLEDGNPVLKPALPERWTRLSFNMRLKGRLMKVSVTQGGAEIKAIDEDKDT